MPAHANPLHLPELAGPRPDLSQQYAYQRLRHALLIGGIQPGIAVTIQDLADALEVSTTPVREALKQLVSTHALTMLKNRRIRVPLMSAARLEELLHLRCNLETYAARRALPYVNNVLIDELERIDDDLDVAVSGQDWTSIVLLNQQFHTSLYGANPDQAVMPMIESVWLQLGPVMAKAARNQQGIPDIDHHKKAIAALRQHDEDALLDAIEADIRDALDRLDPELLTMADDQG
jgi:DNA-binding GntR family transcriptional regulator